MRKIKFRAWDKSAKVMMYDDKSAAHDVDCWDGVNSSTVGLINYQLKNNANFIWEQFIGKDKNEVEVYEGDIVEMEVYLNNYDGEILAEGTYVGEVVMIPSKGACIKNPKYFCDLDGKVYTYKMYKNITASRSRVIGNVHQNLELIK